MEQNLVKLTGDDPLKTGKNAASLAGKRIIFVLKVLSHLAKRLSPRYMETLKRQLTRAYRDKEHARTKELEAEGLARALGVSPEDITWSRKILESLILPACTNFGAVPPATAGGDIIISWNFDAPYIFRILMGSFPLFVREIKGTIPYLCLGVPGLFGIGILNAQGLSCVVNAVGLRDDGPGMSPFELNNTAMETCSTVREAKSIFTENPRQATCAMTLGMLMNWNMIWADKESSLSVFEYSHNHFHEEKAAGDGIIASANHHQFLDRNLTGSFDPETWSPISGSYSRLSRMWRLLRENKGRIDEIRAKEITSDHIPDYTLLDTFGIKREWWEKRIDNSTICAHAWNFFDHLKRLELEAAFLEISMSTTLYSIQIQPLKLTTWLTTGHPCRNDPVPIDWGEILGSKVEHTNFEVREESPHKLRRRSARSDIFRSELSATEKALNRAWYAFTKTVEKSNFSRISKKSGKLTQESKSN